MTKDKICGIYCIENLANGKKYIGLSTNIYKRFNTHKISLNGGYHINEHLQFAWDKYGEENFVFYIIEECDEKILNEKEIYYIREYQTKNRLYGYNKTSGGDGIKDLVDECREKISLAETLYPVVQITLDGQFVKLHRNCSKASIEICGNTSMAENIRSCCLNKYGRKSVYGFIWVYEKDYDENIKYTYKKEDAYKMVVQYDESGNLIKIYDSCCIAEKETGINKKLISSVCHGEKRVAGGYIWRLYGDPFDKYETQHKGKKPVAQYDTDNNFIKIFESQKAVKRELGINIGSALSGRAKTAGGFIWKYAY